MEQSIPRQRQTVRLIAAVLLSAAIAGCARPAAPVAQAPAPTATWTPAPTETPVSTDTPAPTETATPEPTATPTATATATPEPTQPQAAAPTATQTPRPQATATRAATPIPTPEVTIPRGWKKVVDAQLGYSLALPPTWLTFDLQKGELDGIARLLGGAAATEQLQQFLDSPGGENIGLLAVEPDVTQLFARPPFPTFLNVSVAPLADGVTDAQLTAFVEQAASQFGDVQLSSVETKTINNLRAVQAVGVSDLTERGFPVKAFLVVTALRTQDKAYILTIATRAANAESKRPLIDQIVGTFRPE